jgi:hypothetical protein
MINLYEEESENFINITNHHFLKKIGKKYNNKCLCDCSIKYLFKFLEERNIENVILNFKLMSSFNNEIPTNTKKLILSRTINKQNTNILNKYNNCFVNLNNKLIHLNIQSLQVPQLNYNLLPNSLKNMSISTTSKKHLFLTNKINKLAIYFTGNNTLNKIPHKISYFLSSFQINRKNMISHKKLLDYETTLNLGLRVNIDHIYEHTQKNENYI